MFKKKNPVKKLDIKFDERPEQKININIKPLVTIEKHESRVNGKEQAPKFKIGIADRDYIILDEREYDELFSEMLQRMDNDEIMHALYEKHAMAHRAHQKEAMEFMGGLSKFLGENGGGIFEEILKGSK